MKYAEIFLIKMRLLSLAVFSILMNAPFLSACTSGFHTTTSMLASADASSSAPGPSQTMKPTPTPIPTPTPASAPSSFYGVNAHYFQGNPYASNISQQVADMKAMGIGVVRQDCYNTSDTATIATLINSFAPIKIQPVFISFPTSTSSEASVYSEYYAYGQTVAQQLAGKVAIIEMANEPENMYFSQPPSGNGQSVTDWSSVSNEWPAFRGSIRGFYDGFRSIDTAKQTLIASPSVGWLHYGLLTGLWNGQGPDGSSGNPQAKWDITNYHWYYDMGDIQSADGVNTLAVLKSTFALPIILSEIGVQASVTSSVYNSYVNTAIMEYSSLASTYNIIGATWYELYNFDANNGFYMGLYSSPGVDNAGRAAALTSAILANPKP